MFKFELSGEYHSDVNLLLKEIDRLRVECLKFEVRQIDRFDSDVGIAFDNGYNYCVLKIKEIIHE